MEYFWYYLENRESCKTFGGIFLNVRSVLEESLVFFVFSVVGIVLLGSVPFLFTGLTFDAANYITGMKEVVSKVLDPSEIMYQASYARERPIFPLVWGFFLYSSTVLFSAFTIAVLLAILGALLIFLLPESWIRKIRVWLFLLDSFPDVLIAISIQFFVIWFFQKTDFLLFQVVSISGEKTYALPILCLVILPFMMCLRIVLLTIGEEYNKQYVETARALGLSKFRILWRHIMPNTLVSVFHHSKTILWFMLSNLFIIEYIFNIKGIMSFMMIARNPEVFTICILLMFVPMFLFFTAGRLITSRWDGERT